MAITAAQVKELRETSGAGMMDAKKALTETNGDMDAAMDWLRTKGLATAAKKSGRTAAEGLVAVAVSGGKGVAVEVNSETDFVAKNADFQGMVAKIAAAALNVADVDALKDTQVDGKAVSEMITDAIAKIGENMGVRRMAAVSGETVVSYVHNAERQIQIDIARESGKPEAVIEKMIEGRMKKFLGEVTLLGQNFVINPDLTVAAAAKEAGAEIVGYVRMEVGEGIEKVEEDFAAEVAKAMQG